jgi:hypothetical protein
MKFTLPTAPRCREETRRRIALAITEMACHVSRETLDAALRSARAASGSAVPMSTVAELEALSVNARHLARNVDTIRWTSRPGEAVPHEAGHAAAAPFVHRSRSVNAIIHRFAIVSGAFRHIHGPTTAQDDAYCEEPATS